MKWIKINPDELPNGEVLGACFDDLEATNKEKMIGRILKDEYNNPVIIAYDMNSPEPCPMSFPVTHYIDIHNHDDERE